MQAIKKRWWVSLARRKERAVRDIPTTMIERIPAQRPKAKLSADVHAGQSAM